MGSCRPWRSPRLRSARPQRARAPVCRPSGSDDPRNSPCSTRVGIGIARIELDGAPETCHPLVEDLAILFQSEHQLATLEKQIVRLSILGAAPGDTGLFSIAQRDLQRVDDLPRDVILDVEYIGEIAL